MANQNKTIFYGLIFIVAAIVVWAVMMGSSSKEKNTTRKELSEMKSQMGKLAEENEALRTKMTTTELAAKGPVKLDSLVERAQSLYGDTESKRTSGYLWIDRKTEYMIITLGALNGLRPGSKLNVYDGDRVIDSVTVDLPFDIISYVKSQSSIDQYSKDYYRVALE